MNKLEDFRVGDYVTCIAGFGSPFTGVITNRSVQSHMPLRDRWTVKRDDYEHGGDDNGGWICKPETLILIRRSDQESGFFD